MPSPNTPNTSAIRTGYRFPPSGPYIPHGLDVLPLQPPNLHPTPMGLHIQRRLAMYYLRRLREHDAVLAQRAARLAQRRNDFRILLHQIMEARQDVEDDKSDEEEQNESEGAESVTGSNAMDVDLEDGDYDADDDDDNDGGSIEYLEMRSTPAHYPANLHHNSHAQGLPGIVITAINAVQQPGSSHLPVPLATTSYPGSNLQLSTSPSSTRPTFTGQHLSSLPQTPLPWQGQCRLRGGRAPPNDLDADQANPI
ncbi:MAG: hypothetical protein LQ339_003331 [Xanthoria mediterranea]|nr:MAG: hypothetical protein LQ339_003331 [Xanthoria mediterranea]